MKRLALFSTIVMLAACSKAPPVSHSACEEAQAVKDEVLKDRVNFEPDHILNSTLNTQNPAILDTIQVRACDVVALDIQMWGDRPNGRVLDNSFDKFEGEGRLEFITDAWERTPISSPDGEGYQYAVLFRKFYIVRSAKPVKWQIYYSHARDVIRGDPELLMSVELTP